MGVISVLNGIRGGLGPQRLLRRKAALFLLLHSPPGDILVFKNVLLP